MSSSAGRNVVRRIAGGAGWLCLALMLVLGGPVAVQARESTPVVTDHVTVTLVSEVDAFQPGTPFRIGLRFRIIPGWHIYWQNPGDAGTPPSFTLSSPANVTTDPIRWPTPVRLPEGPVMTFGYTGEVLLPMSLTPPTATPESGHDLTLAGDAAWLVCADICVPESGSLHLTIPALAPSTTEPAGGAEAALFAQADSRMPQPSPFAATLRADGTLSVTGAGLSTATVHDAWFFPAHWGVIDHSADQKLAVHEGGLTLALTQAADFATTNSLTGVLTLRDSHGQESNLQLTALRAPAGAPAEAAGSPIPPLFQALAFAFLGGLILNLMPCVFPILAMKALAISQLSGAARRTIRGHALAYTIGVLVAFAALALLLMGLRGAGSLAGWGFQFQSPVFVAAMAWLLFGIGLNLSGLFEVGGGIIGVGQSLALSGGHRGSFFTGLLAVLVATPCTAPFMGAAIAAALAGTPVVTVTIFLAMGLGLAAPYALLALAPGLAALLPRPGGWMVVLKQLLAFPMYGASVWLLWVLSQQAGSSGVLAVAIGFLLLGFAGWVFGLGQRAQGRWRLISQGLVVVAALGIAALVTGIAAMAPSTVANAAAPGDGSEPFAAARLAALRAEGRPVFVDMTAAWCVTCLVNERVALIPTRDAFARNQVVYMKGDWTRQDPEITAFLRDHGRDGVPLYVFFPPHRDPVVLPQILTPDRVLRAITPVAS